MKILKFPSRIKDKQGFTIVEAIVALSIFLIVIALAVGVFTDSFASKRKIELSRLLYEEARIALERVVKEVRRGTIDYEEYFSRTQMGSTVNGANHGQYAAKFFQNDSCAPTCELNKSDVDRFSENIGENKSSFGSAISTNLQSELYLITAEGNEKTSVKLKDDGGEDRIVMLKLPGGRATDGSWTIYNGGGEQSSSKFWDFCSNFNEIGVIPEYQCTAFQFQKIQPDSIKITDLKFFIAPLEDPRKAFSQFTDDIQQQPHVTILMTVEPSEDRLRGIRGNTPTVTLQTTVTARAQNEVKSLNF
jgi:type II secretory pathway pseudopilin PulG